MNTIKKITQITCGALALLILLANATESEAAQCRVYSEEQQEVLELAYSFGVGSGQSLTLAAIAQNESFLGKAVIRVNGLDVDPRYTEQAVVPAGSYGVMHILLSTAIILDGGDPYDNNDAVVGLSNTARSLQDDDGVAIMYALRKLDEVRRHYFGRGAPRSKEDWRLLWGGYNSYNRVSGDAYADRISTIVESFQRCRTFS